MHLYHRLEASSSAVYGGAKAKVTLAVAAAADATSSTSTIASSSSPPSSSSSSELVANVRSLFSSPAPIVVLQSSRAVLLQRRKYVGAHVGDLIDLVICIASIIGALIIIVSYIWNRRSRKLRHALILGLATSDLISSLIITATTSYLLTGQDLGAATKFCNFAGFSFASAVWTQHLWNLSIATITYMILVHPMSSFVSNVERHIVWLWPVFWAIAMIVNGIAWRYVGFTNVDGYCTFNPHNGGALFTAIFQFVPRGFVVVVILVLYTHLFFFLRRTNLFSAVHSNGGSRRNMSGAYMGSHGNNRSTGGADVMSPGASHGGVISQSDTVNDLKGVSSHLRTGSIGRTASVVLAKVRRTYSVSTASAVHSPSTLVGDSNSKRNGSGSTQGKSSQSSGPQLAGLMNTIPMIDSDKEAVSPKSRPAEMDNSSSADVQGREGDDGGNSPSVTLDAGILRPPPVVLSKSSRPNTAPTGTGLDTTATAGRSDIGSDAESAGNSLDDLFQPMAARKDVRDFGMTSPPQEHLRHYSLSAVGVKLAKRAMAETTDDATEAVAGAPDSKSNGVANDETGESGAKVAYEDTLGADWNWGMAVSPGGTATDRQEQPSGGAALGRGPPPPVTARGGYGSRRHSSRWHFWSQTSSRRDGAGTGTSSTGSSTDENGVNATGSTLNRQASVLLLLYPGVYVLLFSLSIVRIIVDLSKSPERLDPRRNSDVLHTISRWTIFAQGAIDAIIFQLIEQQFRRRMKRRRRIAAGEKVEDSCLTRGWQTFSKMLHARRITSADKEPAKQTV